MKITQKQPWAWVFTSSNAGSPITSSIHPKEILHNDDLLQKDAIGSGQWVLAGHDNGANIQFRKFEKFRQFAGTKPIAGQPFLDGINNKTITDDVAALAAFKAGDIDTYGFTEQDRGGGHEEGARRQDRRGQQPGPRLRDADAEVRAAVHG